MAKYTSTGIRALYQGALVDASLGIIGRYPGFLMFYFVKPDVSKNNDFSIKFDLDGLGLGGIGLLGAKLVSDVVLNPLRVLKVYKQSHFESNVSYSEMLTRFA
jgi:hypothetical protein